MAGFEYFIHIPLNVKCLNSPNPTPQFKPCVRLCCPRRTRYCERLDMPASSDFIPVPFSIQNPIPDTTTRPTRARARSPGRRGNRRCPTTPSSTPERTTSCSSTENQGRSLPITIQGTPLQVTLWYKTGCHFFFCPSILMKLAAECHYKRENLQFRISTLESPSPNS